jgi:VanZ family protein
MTRRQLTWTRILFGLYLVAVAVLCFAKFPESEDVPRSLLGIPMDKLVHFLMFFPLPLLAYLAFDRYPGKRWTAALWASVSFLGGCAYAAFTELVQLRLPYRSGDPADFRADFAALAVCSVLILILIFAKPKK